MYPNIDGYISKDIASFPTPAKMKKDRNAAKNFTNRLEVDGAKAAPVVDDLMDEIEESADAGASLTFPAKASALRKGGHVMIKGNPCKIVEMSTSKTGKHGHAKVHLVGLDLLTGKKYEDLSPSTHDMMVPHVKKVEYQVIDMGRDGYLALMDDGGNTRHDIQASNEAIMKKIRQMLDVNEDTSKDGYDSILVCILEVLGKEEVISVKAGYK